MKVMILVFTLALSYALAEALDTTTLDPHQAAVKPDEVKDVQKVDCALMSNSSCKDCLNLIHCKFVPETQACVSNNSTTQQPAIDTLEGCVIVTSVNTNSSVKVDGGNTTTAGPTTTTLLPNTTTTASPNTTTTEATTTATTTSFPNTTTTTPVPPTTSDSGNSTTTQPTTTSSAPTTTTSPDGRGNRFDGWSFFGGILLTLGVGAIAFVSIRYYKARTGQMGSTNYNRF